MTSKDFKFNEAVEHEVMKPFVTGTAAYGPFTEDSDIDIVMFYTDADLFKALLEKARFKIEEPDKIINPEYKGYEFDLAGRTIQIICSLNPEDHAAWLRATEAMRSGAQIENRQDRIDHFRQLYNQSP